MFIHLVLDLSGSITHVNTRVHIRSTHLRLWALESGEKFRVEERGFRVFEFLSDISRKTKVWVLVYCAGDQAGDVGYFTENIGKGIGE